MSTDSIAPDVLARARGCLLGQVAGDSLGALVEFREPADIAAEYPDGVRELADGGRWKLLAGQPTDDSELALALARTLVECRGFDDEAVARAYVRWLKSEPFSVGGTIRRALSEAAGASSGGVAVAARGAAGRAVQSNGALMRVSPLGVFGHAMEPAALAELARRDASLTHAHPTCLDASAVFAATIGRAVAAGDDAAALYEFAVRFADAEAMDDDVRRAVGDAPRGNASDFGRETGTVCISLQNAFWQLLNAGGVEAGVVDTVMRGWDTDTNAAIAGAMLGAVYGESAIPRQWRDAILNCQPVAGHPNVRRPRPREWWPTDVLALADGLVIAGAWMANDRVD